MTGAWQALVSDKPLGPMSSAELLRAHFRGQYGADTLVRADGAGDWRKLSEAFPIADITPPPLPDVAAVASPAPTAAAKPDAWTNEPPYAWRRYFARQLDTLLHAYIMFVFLGAVLAGSDSAYLAVTGMNNALLLNIIGVALSVIPSSILIGTTGRTFGKLIFGLKVLNAEGRAPGLFRSFKRELQLLFQGLAVGVPLISLFTLIASFTRLGDQGHADWDAGNDLTTWYRRPTFVHWILMLGGVALWVSAVALFVSAGRHAG